jgi:hypothetical protein
MSSIFAQASHTLSEKCAVTSAKLSGSVAIRDDFQNGKKTDPARRTAMEDGTTFGNVGYEIANARPIWESSR